MVAELQNTIQPEPEILRTCCCAIAETSSLPMAEVEGSTHILRYVNPAFCLLTAKPKKELIGRAFSDIAPAEEECLASLDRVYRSGQAITHTGQEHSAFHPLYRSYSMWPLLTKDNRPRGIIVQVTEAISFHLNAVAMNQALMMGSVRQHELTEESQKLLERLQAGMLVNQQAHEALIGSHKRYLDLYEFAPIGYLTLDAASFISEINMNGALLLGEVRTHLLSRRFAQFVTPQDLDRYDRLFKRVLKQGKRQTFDLALRRGDGSVFHAQLDCVRAIAEDTNPIVRVTIVDITERKRAETEIEHLAFYDSLTQLPNRRFLLGRLQAAVTACARTLRHGAILFIDLDGFKMLNDTQGHFVGDLLLQQVALRLSACVREGDTVARLGGDEFVVMLADLSKHPMEASAQTQKVGEKLLKILNEPYLLAGYEYRTSGSIGTTLFSGDHESLEDLLKRADLAVYCAKTAGRNRLRFFDPEMQIAATTRAVLDADLRKALKERQFVLFYQPQVDRNGRLTGAEALIRWQHPTRGLVSPAEFIPFAEESGLIEFVGQWALETACAQLVAWGANLTTAHLRLAINVSAHEFCHPEFVSRTLTTIDRFGINPQKLMLELTESAMFTTVDETLAKMAALKTRGVCFSIDDFGIGYSSLTYLKNMPLDQLKLDRSFVADVLKNPNDAAIARTIIALGESLDIDVIAEGVETEGQRSFLALHGCHAYQGFLFGRPGPIEDLLSMVGTEPVPKTVHRPILVQKKQSLGQNIRNKVKAIDSIGSDE
jgi:diguanylate cyclase (GGDEF)-like protein/PAS domain S-box-containing protein